MIPSLAPLFAELLFLLASSPSLLALSEPIERQECAENASDDGDRTCDGAPREVPENDANADDLCRDLRPECSGWARAGECAANPDFMLNSCARSCGKCAASRPGAPTAGGPTAGGESGHLPDDFVDPCKDENENCFKWAQEGECVNNPNYMLSTCARSCGSCVSLGEGEGVDPGALFCSDEFEACEEWAKGAECWVNPLFMQYRCKESCWKCVNPVKDFQAGVKEDVIAKKKLFANMDTGRYQLLPRINDRYKVGYRNGADDANPLTEEEFEKLRSTVRQMDHYARFVMTDPSVPPKARERCRNDSRMCAEWASRGMCLPMGLPRNNNGDGGDADESYDVFDNRAGPDDVLFMMNNCPLACRTCGELDSFHKCAGRRHPLAEPSFRSGELDSFFEGKRGAGKKWAEYKPLFASYPNALKVGSQDDPYVVILQKFLSEEEADRLWALGSGTVGGATTSDVRSSRNPAYAKSARCQDSDHCNDDDVYQRVMHRVSSLTNTTTSHLEPMEIVHFHSSSDTRHGSTYQHNFEVDGLWKPTGPRVLSLYLFLSDASEGGGGDLWFPYLDWLHIKPKKGTAVLWPNVRNDNLLEPDPRATFEHFPSQGGDGGAAGYVHVRLHNLTDASLRGCA